MCLSVCPCICLYVSLTYRHPLTYNSVLLFSQILRYLIVNLTYQLSLCPVCLSVCPSVCSICLYVSLSYRQSFAYNSLLFISQILRWHYLIANLTFQFSVCPVCPSVSVYPSYRQSFTYNSLLFISQILRWHYLIVDLTYQLCVLSVCPSIRPSVCQCVSLLPTAFHI